MQTIDEIPTPALIVDLDRVERNISAMAARCRELGVRLRPHIKTHKCVEIGQLQVTAGARGITVSTPYEATVFADAGFDDITWAFPLIPSRVDEMRELADRVTLGLVVDSTAAVEWLRGAAYPFRTWIKVDCGYQRAGLAPDSPQLTEVAAAVQRAGLQLVGLLSHSGDAYDAGEVDVRATRAERERAGIVRAAARLRAEGHGELQLSVGSTPGMTAVEDLTGVTEARPGNYVFFDRTQLELGCCAATDCGVSVVSTVVSSGAEHSICDAGALVMSKDMGPGDGSYGEIWADHERGELRSDVRLCSVSQEHGKLDGALDPGTRLRILPNHSCLTVACFTELWAVRGNVVQDRWRVWNGRA